MSAQAVRATSPNQLLVNALVDFAAAVPAPSYLVRDVDVTWRLA